MSLHPHPHEQPHTYKRPCGHGGDHSHVRDVYSCTLRLCESAGESVGVVSSFFHSLCTVQVHTAGFTGPADSH